MTRRRMGREEAVRRSLVHLERFGWPRVQMSLIVAFTGLAGFGASIVLRAVGVVEMWQRYPLAVGVAFVAFLLQLWLWMRTGDTADSVFENLEVGSPNTGSGVSRSSSNLDTIEAAVDTVDLGADIGSDALGVAAEGEGCALVVAVIVLAIVAGGLLFAAGYVVTGAPALLAELLVDGALSVGLYRSLRRQDESHWLVTALRHTGLVFLLTAALLSGAGWVLAQFAPGAQSFGEAIERISDE